MTTTPLPYSYNRGKQEGSVFIFNRDSTRHEDGESSDDEVYQMKSVRSRSKRGPESKDNDPQDTISHELHPGDTLPSLSLKYNCKVSEIKRINHIWNANELSARNNILIPVAKHSLLLEPDSGKCPAPATIDAPEQKIDIRTISIKSLGDSANTEQFLARMNADIETLLKETREKTRKSSMNEVKTALTVERIFPKQVSKSRTGLSYSTIALIFLGFCFVFVGIPITLVYWDVVMEGILKTVPKNKGG